MKYIFDLMIIIIIYYLLNKKMYNECTTKEIILYNVLFFYLASVYALTLMPFRPLKNLLQESLSFGFHLEPFGDIIHSRGPAVREALLNILMLVPFGFLVPLIRKRKTMIYHVIISSFLLSFIIETLQMFDLNRSSDVTDLITNTIGGLVGFLIFKIFKMINKKGRNRI